jgi:hypothetical protein
MNTVHTSKGHVKLEAQKRIQQLLAENKDSPTRVGRLLGVNKGLVWRVAHGGYSEMVCLALGLDIVKPVDMPICLECGQVHEVKRTCDTKRNASPPRRRKAADLSPTAWGKIQSRALDEIAHACNGGGSWSDYVVWLAEGRISEWPAEKLEEIVAEALSEEK